MSNESLPRRDFGRALAAGTVGLAIRHGPRSETAAADERPLGPLRDPGPEDAPFGPPPPHFLMVEFIRQRYPNEGLTDEVLQRIEADVRGNIARGEVLARVELTNADEPAHPFAAYRANG